MTALRWAVTDTWTMTTRNLEHWLRQPGPVLVNLLFPVLTVLMFGYLLGGGMAVPGGGSYREFLVPGMFAMAMLFGLETTMTAVATDAARGVTDRFRAMPMATGAVVAGRGLADLLNSVAGLAIMLACGLAVGWRWHAGLGRAALAAGLLLLLRLALIWAGIWLGLVVKGPESVAIVQILVWPLGFLSSAFVSPGTMPGWLGAIAAWNPLSATASATRELFGNPTGITEGPLADGAVWLAVGWPLLLTAVFLPLSARAYRKLRI